jgi:hypothetical protein
VMAWLQDTEPPRTGHRLRSLQARGYLMTNPTPADQITLNLLRLRTHNQKITIAARAMAERKTLGFRS